MAHWVFALLTIAGILIALQLQARDLVTYHENGYLEYRCKTPLLIPTLGRAEAAGRA